MSRRSWQVAILLPATLTMGLTAGVFGDWAHTIMRGLGTTDDRTFVGAFQALDGAILNPLFMLTFLGALVFTGVAAVLYLRDDDRSVLPWVALAGGLHLATFVITMAVHEPLNGVLRAAGDPDHIADLSAVRDAFQETRWVAWHLVRTIATTAAFGCLAWALVLHGRATADAPPRGPPLGPFESDAMTECPHPGPPRTAVAALVVAMVILIGIVLVFAGIRIAEDWPVIAARRLPPPEDYQHPYVAHPVLAYLHILPGVIYLIGAPLQLWRRFRERHFTVHRRLGRLVLAAGLVSGVYALLFGWLYSFGGVAQALATAVFGGAFVTSLGVAFVAIKRGDVTRHRRWMIRAFALGLAVGTIRVWIWLFQVFGVLSYPASFAVAFWVAFPMHAVAAELYLWWRPVRGRSAERVPHRV